MSPQLVDPKILREKLNYFSLKETLLDPIKKSLASYFQFLLY